MASVRGQLLVATSAIEAGPFWRSVVYVLDHDEDGALGVIVNRPMESDVDEVLPDWGEVANAPGRLFEGGPVGMDSALAVGVVTDVSVRPVGWRQTAGRVGLVDLDGPPPAGGELLGLRVFAGYAGWSPEQLEAEIEAGAWLVLPAQDGDLISPIPELLWNEVLRRQRGEVRFWANLPDDPGLN
ncbi:YqgE/AlgH family protein [Aeromicrobium duanguangcaii]|uniref:YqgE/AlgH family protein n=1 Tax=Aeromicrobium duanguangcaii TaxID=2968086 RepID=A0ABY5KFL0_9ACTN|nr:YqgE/AlgH family protein [Aeromicrobium duanguangcaii]MCD9154674.1 YqgE/AlgH family protein [Aeromicrobium duanguangcaii]MCL3838796.1 YqgE/AlgH family protein [Aeromicrobium duanguangcaii]UUI67912.1 YqgE/AlgH family protein [Aeromicrobium duanguangcaii]